MQQLTEWQAKMREKAQQLTLGAPPPPWTNYVSLTAGNIFAAGWTKSSNLLMISTDGYSVSNAITGEQMKFVEDGDEVFARLSDDGLSFQLSPDEQVSLFGVHGGDGIHSNSSWKLKIIYPWWPNATVVLYSDTLIEWKTVYGIELKACDPGSWLKCGFAPSGEAFAIFGSGGVDCYARQDASE